MADLSYDKPTDITSSEGLTDNILVSNILYNVKRQLDKLNCKYELDFDIPKNIKPDSMDLSSLLINIFDNAIEALTIYMAKPKKKKIAYHLKAYGKIEDNMLKICVENVKSPSQKTRRLNNTYVTSKVKKELHGYGMQIIDKIVKKYDGNMKVEYTDTRFCNSIELKI